MVQKPCGTQIADVQAEIYSEGKDPGQREAQHRVVETILAFARRRQKGFRLPGQFIENAGGGIASSTVIDMSCGSFGVVMEQF